MFALRKHMVLDTDGVCYATTFERLRLPCLAPSRDSLPGTAREVLTAAQLENNPQEPFPSH